MTERPVTRQPVPGGEQVSVTVDGAAWTVPAGITIAAAFTRRGQPGWRRTRLRGEPRGCRAGSACASTAWSPSTARPASAPAWPRSGRRRHRDRGRLRLHQRAAGPGRLGAGARTARRHAGGARPGPARPGPVRHCGHRGRGRPDRGGGRRRRRVHRAGARPRGAARRPVLAVGPATADGRFHHGWPAFTALRDRFAAHQASGRIVYRPGHAVFQVQPPAARAGSDAPGGGPGRWFAVHAVAGDRERGYAGVAARAVIVATGAYDLQLPVPGWTLPGVMAAGAAQSLLKSSAVTAGRRVVVAGTGPFLLPVAAGLVQAGARVVAVAEAGQPLDYLRHPAVLAASWRKLPEAGGYLARLARHRVPVLRRHAVIAARGEGRLESVTAGPPGSGLAPRARNGADAGRRRTRRRLRLRSPGRAARRGRRAAGPGRAGGPRRARRRCRRRAGPADHRARPVRRRGDDRRRRQRPGPRRGGDRRPRRRPLPRPRRRAAAAGRRPRSARSLRQFAAVMQAVHAVQPGWAGWPGDDTVICRCEEVTLGQLRAAAGLGADDARSVKLLARPGMGWCQGRICGPPVAALLATGPGLTATEDAGRQAGPGAAGKPRPADQEPGEPGPLPGPRPRYCRGRWPSRCRSGYWPGWPGSASRARGRRPLSPGTGAAEAGTPGAEPEAPAGEASARPDDIGKM